MGNDPVTRNDDRQWICADRVTDRTSILGSTHTRGDPLIRAEFAVGDPLQCPPDLSLERCSLRQIKRHIKSVLPPCNIVEQLAAGCFQSRGLSLMQCPI